MKDDPRRLPVVAQPPLAVLSLYVARGTANSAQAEQNLARAMKQLDDSGVGLGLEIVDFTTSPNRAITDGVFVTPTLVGTRAGTRLTMMGNLSDTVKVKLFLQSLHDGQTIARIEALVAAKDELLAEHAIIAEELNHRIRNNFHLVQAMLAAHLETASRPGEIASVAAIIRRVATLATVYDQLLGVGFSRTIDLGRYISTLCESLPGLQPASREGIILDCSVQPLLVPLDTASVMGMLVAEAVSNSYKHAFSGAAGTISVVLERDGETAEGILSVRDNGSGFTAPVGGGRHGVGLLRQLILRVNGTATLGSEAGTCWTFRFPAPAETTAP